MPDGRCEVKVFVAGASGAIGRPLVRQLVDAGHEVAGTIRREGAADEIRSAGATGVACDALDAEALRAALAAAAPEVAVHALTAIPERFDWKADPLAATNRLRDEGTRNFLAAAEAAGVRRVVVESVAFLYAPQGDWVKDEEAELFVDAPPPFGAAVEALASLERQVGEAEGIEGVILRFGNLYGPGTMFAADGSQADEARRRRLPIVGDGAGTFSFIHVEDAATAIVAAIERGAPGTYNIVDDEPTPMREWVPAYTEALGAPSPRRVPLWLAGVVVGRSVAANTGEVRGASNAKAKRELGWQPRYASWRQGFREALG
jgi:nucleoside-diphosphate-sugar epimerase